MPVAHPPRRSVGLKERQLSLLASMDEAPVAVDGTEVERGAFFTRPEVSAFLLDLLGYTADADLTARRLLEPGCGNGAILRVAVGRLLESAVRAGKLTEEELTDAVVAVELHPASAREAREAVKRQLTGAGLKKQAASRLAAAWVVEGDFLLEEERLRGGFTDVVGNPPYVRQERVEDGLLAAYRTRHTTLYDRADLYVLFFERALRVLDPGGRMCFICADRWMKNRYGTKLRGFIGEHAHLAAYVDMTGINAFEVEVDAYPGVTLFRKEEPEHSETACVYRPSVDALADVAEQLVSGAGPDVLRLSGVVRGTEPWLVQRPERLSLVRCLEERFPTLEEAGCSVGIGVATGADKAFIGSDGELDVEPERKLPLVVAKDLDSGELRWSGRFVLNPFGEDGKVVDLDRWPRFAAFVEARRDLIGRRFVAKKNPNGWFRTIDAIHPELVARPKLLVPDIRSRANFVLDEPGTCYPHHNLYYIVSDRWPLRALQRVLRSSVCLLFITAYSTEMRGGYVRFQAQYLRRLRLPEWATLGEPLREELLQAAVLTADERDELVSRVFGIDAGRLAAALSGDGLAG